ncbi:MAG: phosphate regulon sensor histidine kinase PhoR [Pseudomonadota bacterium]
MPGAWRNLLLGVAGLLLAGFAVGYFLGYPSIGVAVAMGGILAYHLQRLLELERTLSLRNAVKVPDGDGIWARVLAGVRYQQQRVRRHKGRHRHLMKELRQSTNALPDGVIALNESNEIQRFNAAAQSIIGLRRRRDRGQRIDNLIRHPDFISYLSGDDFSQPLVIPAPRDENGWLSLRVVPYNDNNRLLVLRDVTERTRLTRMRRDFVANASHELRTPLTVISGYLEALQADEQIAAEWDKPLHEMSQQAQRMRSMLDELLALSRLEISPAATITDPVDLAAAINDSVGLLGSSATRVRVRVESATQLLGEYAEITSVISNLLSNAVRYSWPDSDIEVRWFDDGDAAVLAVTDASDGIAPSDIPRLTERFYRVNRGRGRDSGGVGLGLAIVKHVLMRHGAELEIDSQAQVGSTFSCRFPAERLVYAQTDDVVNV